MANLLAPKSVMFEKDCNIMPSSLVRVNVLTVTGVSTGSTSNKTIIGIPEVRICS